MGREYERTTKVISTIPQPVGTYLFDDFEPTLFKWKGSARNASGAFARDTAQAFNGEASMKLDTGATSPASGDWVRCFRDIASAPVKKVRASMLILQTVQTASLWEELLLGWENYGDLRDFRIRWNPRTQDLQYWGSDGAWHDVPGQPPYPPVVISDRWAQMQLIVDVLEEKYLEAIINTQRWDLSGLDVYIGEGEVDGSYVLRFTVGLVTNANARAVINIDDVLAVAEF